MKKLAVWFVVCAAVGAAIGKLLVDIDRALDLIDRAEQAGPFT